MKFLIVLALVAAASAATLPHKRTNLAELDEIMAAIHSPSTDPATAAALEQMLQDILGAVPSPIQVGPAIIDPIEEISVGPAIVKPVEEISVGPAIVKPVEEISVGPAIIDPIEEISVGPALVDPAPPAFNPAAFKGPLVQVIVNVKSDSSDSVTVEQPALVPAPGGDINEIKPDPVIVVDSPQPVVIAPEPINVANPIFPDTAANLPEELN